jgi:hypothetical protein
MMEQPDPHWMQLLCGWFCFLPVVRSWLDEVFWEVPISSSLDQLEGFAIEPICLSRKPGVLIRTWEVTPFRDLTRPIH